MRTEEAKVPIQKLKLLIFRIIQIFLILTLKNVEKPQI